MKSNSKRKAVAGFTAASWLGVAAFLFMVWALLATTWAMMADYSWWLMRAELGACASINERRYQLWQQEYLLQQRRLQLGQPASSALSAPSSDSHGQPDSDEAMPRRPDAPTWVEASPLAASPSQTQTCLCIHCACSLVTYSKTPTESSSVTRPDGAGGAQEKETK